MSKRKIIFIRHLFYLLGMFVMAFGVSVSVLSELGVSPISSVPYSFTCVFGLELGTATILFHVFLVALEKLILRRRFRRINVLQLAVSVVFGKSITLTGLLLRGAAVPETLAGRIALSLCGCLLLALGIFLYVPAGYVPVAGEGISLAAAEALGRPFSSVKLGMDILMVAFSAAFCFINLHAPGSVGVGTVIAAVTVGVFLKILDRLGGKTRDRLLRRGTEETK